VEFSILNNFDYWPFANPWGMWKGAQRMGHSMEVAGRGEMEKYKLAGFANSRTFAFLGRK